MNPSELSAAFIDAFNKRDAETMRDMLAPNLVYIRPGPLPLDGVEAVMAQYDQDWQQYDPQIRVRRMIEQGDSVAVEIVIAAPAPEGVVEVGGAAVHRWVDDRLVGYRLYTDPLPEGQ